MNKQELKEAIADEYRRIQLQYINYLIALSVTCIGFAVYNTRNEWLDYHHIFVGIAVILWGYSVHNGFTYVRRYLTILYGNKEYFEHIDTKPSLADAIKEKVEKNVETTKKYFNRQTYSFYVGIVFYIMYHILSMYNESVLIIN